jgi:catechol 2,3-dioxygenase-like lactoylglutathione lyase family enzyme
VTLQHVSLETRPGDADAEVAFWGLLGLVHVDPPGSLRERSTWVQAGATQIHLLYSDAPVVPPHGHVAVVCAAFDETVASLRAAGFSVEPRAEHWEQPRAYVRSPGGHLVEVMAAPPTV